MAKLLLKNVRLSYPSLFVARGFKNQPNSERYSAAFLISKKDKAQMKALEDTILEAAKLKWADKAEAKLKALRGNSNKFCLTDGDTADNDGYEGHMILSSNRKPDKGRPVVIDRDKTPLTEADGKPYAGCYVNATVDIWAQDGEYTGIRATLLGVQFFADGQGFAPGAVPSEDDFEDLGDAAEGEELA